MSTTVRNIISEDLTGYIRIQALESRLRFIFGMIIQKQNERYTFDAPRRVDLSEIE
ncbi:hypothetical protein BDV12DRAFT_193379 [Aspergillus spectabilis]